MKTRSLGCLHLPRECLLGMGAREGSQLWRGVGIEGALHPIILEGDLSQQRASGDGEVRSQIVKRRGEANGETSSPHTTSIPRLHQPL